MPQVRVRVSGRKAVLLVEDDEGTLRVLSDGLSKTLGMFDVITAHHGREAIEVLESRPVDVLVTDLAMPVMDGFALIAYVTNRRPTLPVVVFSGLAPADVDHRLAARGGLQVLRKPAGYQEVAAAVLAVLERADMGSVEGIPLASVLQLLESERRTCTVLVTSGKRRGRLHFQSGRLLNAFSDDFGAEGEAAAYDIMSWGEAAIEFESLPEGVRKLIYTPLQLMLIELATTHDEALNPRRGFPVPAAWGFGADEDAGDEVATTAPRETSDPVAETVDPETVDAPADPTVAAHPGQDPRADGDELALITEPDPTHAEATTVEDVVSIARSDVTEDAVDALRTLRPWEAPDMDEPRDPPAPDEATHDHLGDVFVRAPETGSGNGSPADPQRPEVDPSADGEASDPATAAAAAVTPAAPGDAPAVSSSPATEPHVAQLLEAIERLARRAKDADAALAAVAEEVDAFRGARRRFDEVHAQREQRRLELEALRTDVAHLAREILGRVDGMFDVFAEPPSTEDAAAEAPAST